MTIALALAGTIAQALAGAVQRLKASDVPDAGNDARILLAVALNIERSRLTLVMPMRCQQMHRRILNINPSPHFAPASVANYWSP